MLPERSGGAALGTKVKEQVRPLLKRLLSSVLPRSVQEARPAWREWGIGIYQGSTPFSLAPAPNVENPVLTRRNVSDMSARFVADPFMLRRGHTWYMFFEVMDRQTRKGSIGLAVSENGRQWKYQQIVLQEPFHLSYPYAFEWNGEQYMLPESYQANSVCLYKALDFPIRWSRAATLLSGQFCTDPSIFQFGGKWWLFVETSAEQKSDTLRLYCADDLMGPWLEHPASPIVNQDERMARPAGRVLVLEDRVIRYAQDCFPAYGTQVRAFEITELTSTSYREREVVESPILGPSGRGWNASGMHHIDLHRLDTGQWLACVDGWLSVEG
jgi:hypothetical protein